MDITAMKNHSADISKINARVTEKYPFESTRGWTTTERAEKYRTLAHDMYMAGEISEGGRDAYINMSTSFETFARNVNKGTDSVRSFIKDPKNQYLAAGLAGALVIAVVTRKMFR